MVKARSILAGFLLAGIVAGVAWWLTSLPGEPDSAPRNATLLPAPKVLTDFELNDEQGNRFTRDNLRGQWTLLFFGFTHCPDVCPLTLQTLAAARRGLQEQGHDVVPQILFVSVDPERDSRDAVATYVSRFGDGVGGARAELPALQELTRDLGIFFAREPGTGTDYDVSHSSAVLLINPDAELHAVLSAPHAVPALVHDLPLLMAAR